MFSYTDDAIVTSSPTGRHLSTVIRRPAGMPDNGWTQHADQVCGVLNELDSKAKASSLSLHMQTVGRVYRHVPNGRSEILAELRSGPTWPYRDQTPLSFGAVPPAGPMPLTSFVSARIVELEKQVSSLETECLNTRDRLKETEKQLGDATTKLCAVQMLLEKEKAQSIHLTPAELQSGYSRVDWAAGLIRQLPETHEGRNSWLLNYAGDK